MGFKNLFRFAIESLSSNIKMLIMTLLVMSSGIVLIIMAMTLYEDSKYNEKSTDELLVAGNDHTGYLMMSDMLTAQKSEVINELKKNSDVNVGFVREFCCSFSGKGIEELAARQKALRKEKGISEMFPGNEIEGINIKSEIFKMCDVSLQDGQISAEVPEDCVYIYLGSEFKDVEVGTTYEVVCSYGGELGADNQEFRSKKLSSVKLKFIVKGHFAKNQKYIAPEILDIAEGINVCATDLDDQVVIVSNNPIEPSAVGEFFVYGNKEDTLFYDNMKNTIENIKSNEDYKISYGTISDIFDKHSDNQSRMIGYIVKLAVMVTLTVIVIQLCVSSIMIINGTKRYGIMYANGFSKKDMIGIIIMEAVLKCVMSILLAIIIGYVGIQIVFGSYQDVAALYERVMMIVKKYVLIKAVGISFVISIVGAYVPIIIISKQMPVKLIKSLGE